MDNITHTLTGVLLARAGLNRLTPRASLLMAVALNSPDIDVLWSWGREAHIYLDHHRGFTHSVFFTPLIALIPLAVTRQFHWRAYLAAVIGVLTHIAQDTSNVYGIRSLWPASDHWFRLDWVNVIDPWIWLLLLLGVLWPKLAALVSGEIGAKPSPGTAWARSILVLLALYVGARGVLHGRAVDLIAARNWSGQPPLRAAAFPSSWNPIAWRGFAETRDSWHAIDVDLTRELFPDRARVLNKISPSNFTQAASATVPFRVFLYFSQFPLWTSVADPDDPSARLVQVCDLRFGLPGESTFCASARVLANGQVQTTDSQLSRPGELPKPR